MFIELVGHGLSENEGAEGMSTTFKLHPRVNFLPPAARTYPRVAWLFRSRTWMIQETVLPVLAVSAFAFAYAR